MPETSLSLRQLVEKKYDAGAGALLLDRASFGDQIAGLLTLLNADTLKLDAATLSPTTGSAAAPGTWSLSGTTAIWGAQQCPLQIDVAPGQNNLAAVRAAASLPSISVLSLAQFALPLDSAATAALGSVTLTNCRITAIEPDQALGFRSVIADGWAPFGLKQAHLENTQFALGVVTDPDGGYARKAIVTGNLALGTSKLPVEIDVPIGGGSWTLGLVPPGITVGLLSDIAQLFGDDTYRAALPKQLVDMATLQLRSLRMQFDPGARTWSGIDLSLATANPWPIAGNIKVENVGLDLRVRPGSSPLVTGTVYGSLKVDSLTFQTSIPVPLGGAIRLTAQASQPLPGFEPLLHLVDAPFAASLPDGIAKLGSLRINSMFLDYQLDAGPITALGLELASTAPWTLIPNYLALDNLRFGIDAFKLSGGWQIEGHGSGTISVAGFRVGVAIEGESGLWAVQLTEPLQLPGIGELAKLVGGKDPAAVLPAGFDAGLGALAVNRYAMAFGGPTNALQSLSVEFRTANPWKFCDPGLVLDMLDVSIDVVGSAQNRVINASINGVLQIVGFDLVLSGQTLAAGPGSGWLLTGTAQQDSPVALGALVGELAQKLGAAVPTDLINAIGTIQVETLDVAVTTKDKSFQLLADVTTKGRVPLGDRSYDVDLKAYISSTVDAAGKRGFAGHLEGDLTIGKAAFVVSFDFGPAAKVLKASWRDTDGSTLSFTDIAEALHVPRGGDVPKDLDLGLKAASFEYQSASSTFMLSAESTSFGDAFFTAGKDQNGRMGFVFGVDLPANLKLSSLPGIGEHLKPADFLTFKQGAVLVSSGNFPSYQLPALPALPPAASGTGSPWTARFASGRSIKPVTASATLTLTTSGLSLAAIVDFAATSDVRAKNLRTIAGADEMMLQASIGGGGLRLLGALAGQAAVRGGSSRLSLSQPRVEIDCGPEVTFQVFGGVNFTVRETPVTATARLVINETEAQVAVDIAGQQKPLPPLPGIKGLHIDSFGVVMGVYFAPPGLDLGLTGNFTLGSVENLKGDSFGIVLEVLEEAANVLYLAFYVDQLDLGEVLSLFTDRSEPALVQSLDFIKASDLGFHWCDSIVTLPDGSIVPPGFGFSASLDVLGFGAHADLEVGTDGIHGEAQIAPFSLKGVPDVADNGASKALGQFGIGRPHTGNAPDVLTVSGDGNGITRTYQEINGTWQQVDNAAVKRTLPAPPTRIETIVAAGGPMLQFNCKQAPFVQAGLTVALFEAHAAVTAHVDQTGFGFGLDFDVGNIEKFTLNCTLQDKDHFAASSAVGIKIDASVGPIHVAGHDCGRLHLATRVDGSLAVTLDPSHFSLTLDGTFNFQGLTFSIPHLSLDVAPAKLAQLPPALIEVISGQADQIFHQLYDDGAHWAGLVKSGVITGAGDVATTLKDAYHMTSDQAQQAMRSAGYDADTAAKAVEGAFGTVASGLDSAGHAIGQGASDAGQDIKHEGEQVGHDIGDGLKHAFHL